LAGPGSVRTTYGESEATGPGGEPLGTFESYEKISAFGIGLSLAQAAEAIGRATGSPLPSIACAS